MKRLITDRDVLEGRAGAEIVLDGETILTPSARDRAVRLGIPIVEASGPGARGPAGAVAGAKAAMGANAGVGRGPASPCAGAGPGACAACGGRGCEGCGRVASPTDAGPLARLPDGVYLVRVEDGRAVRVDPAAGPGMMRPAR